MHIYDLETGNKIILQWSKNEVQHNSYSKDYNNNYRIIHRWSCIKQLYSVVQIGHGPNNVLLAFLNVPKYISNYKADMIHLEESVSTLMLSTMAS